MKQTAHFFHLLKSSESKRELGSRVPSPDAEKTESHLVGDFREQFLFVFEAVQETQKFIINEFSEKQFVCVVRSDPRWHDATDATCRCQQVAVQLGENGVGVDAAATAER